MAGWRDYAAVGRVPDRHMRLDVGLVHHPPQEVCRAVGGVADEPLGFYTEAIFDTIDHRLSRPDFRRSVGRRCLDIHDDAGVGVYQIVR
jgi:hypothetical protein